MNRRFFLMLPINLVTAFQVLTLVLFYFGPIKRQLINPILLFLYLIAVFASLRLGYISYITSKDVALQIKRGSRQENIQKKADGFESFKINVVLALFFVCSCLILLSRTGSVFLDFASFKNLGQAYYDRGDTILLLERIVVVLSPITTMFVPYIVLKWKKLGFLRKTVFFLLIIHRVLVDLIQGVNKSFADYLLLFVICSIFMVYNLFLKNPTKGKKTLFLFAFISILFLLLFCSVFSSNILSRTSIGVQKHNYSGLEYLVSYLTEGYQAVDYSLSQPFTTTFGLGNSLYFMQAFNLDWIIQRTYLYKNEILYGWSMMVNWSSLYVWIGNDVSMFGVIPVMFLVGRLFARTWSESILDDKKLPSLVVAGLMFQLCIYSSANNQIVQIQTAFVGTWFWLLYWLLFNRISKIGWGKKKI